MYLETEWLRALYRPVYAKQREYRGKWRNTGQKGDLKAILTELSLSLSFSLHPPPFHPSADTRGRILIQPRWLLDKPDGFDGYEVFGSRLSTIQRKFALSLSLSLGWPYSLAPCRGISGRNVVKVPHPVFSPRRLARRGRSVWPRESFSTENICDGVFHGTRRIASFRKFLGICRSFFFLHFCAINRQLQLQRLKFFIGSSMINSCV